MTVRRVAHAPRRRKPDPIAWAARQIDADDAVERTARSVARGIRRTENGDDWCAHSYGEVHRTCIPCHEEIHAFDQAGERQEIDVPRDINDPVCRQP